MNRFCEAKSGLAAVLSVSRGNRVLEPATGGKRRCLACGSGLDPLQIPSLKTYRRCTACGMMLDLARTGSESTELLIRHYIGVDPHEEVAASKAAFFRLALKELNVQVTQRPRRLMDVGCSYGYFLEMAAAAEWGVLGVEIVPEAVRIARKRVPAGQVFEGDLRQARLDKGCLEAVTLWDVLDQVEDPAAELKESHRILAPGGTISIRVRNAASQLWIHRCYCRIEWLWRMLGLKPPSTFHRYSFSREAIERLLAETGFVHISARNSPLTQGDPYRHAPIRRIAGTGKRVVGALAEVLYRLTGGRRLIAPSLLVWAQKP